MKKILLCLLIALCCHMEATAQVQKVYNETIDPIAQIDAAVGQALHAQKHVICQVGGNWCPWCLLLADFVSKDSTIAQQISDNYVYIHVNYPRRDAAEALMQKLGNPGRFGYPALVVLDGEGRVIHIQDSSFLEEGKGYDQKKVLRFLQAWTPQAVAPAKK